MVQNTSHEPRNSICQVLSQNPSEMRSCLEDSPIVCLWIPISSQDLKAIPRSICLLSPASGIVRRAKGQVLGKCTNSCSFSCPSSNGAPAASSLVTPLEYRVRSIWYGQYGTFHLPGHEKHHRLCQICPGQRPLMRPLHQYIQSP